MSGDEHFVRLCESLSENDPSTTWLQTSELGSLSEGYGRRLGEALLYNTHVTFLDLDIATLLSDDDTDVSDALVLVRYVQSNETLKELVLVSEGNHPLRADLIHRVMEAASRNPSIVFLHALVSVSPHDWANALRQTTSVVDMYVFVSDFSVPSTQRLVATAFAENQTLEKLSLVAKHGQDSNEAAIPIFLQLGSHSRLRDIMLVLGYQANLEQFQAMAHFLRCTKTLEHLSLLQYEFENEECIELVLQAVQANPMIAKVTLSGCTFDAEARDSFVYLMNDQRFNHTPVMKELHLRPVTTVDLFEDFTIGSTAAMALWQSSLEILSFGEGLVQDVDVVGFFETLMANHHPVFVQTLQFTHVDVEGCAAMARFLPTTTTLRSLSVSKIHDLADKDLLLSAIHQNGSLLDVDMERYVGGERGYHLPFFEGPELVRLEAYLVRNREMPLLLAKPCLYKDGENTLASTMSDIDPGLSLADLTEFPTLYCAAQQAPAVAVNNIFIGLLAAVGDVLGPDSDDSL